MQKWCVLAIVALVFSTAQTYSQDLPDTLVIPRTATALEGVPTVLVTSDEDSTETQKLSPSDSTKNRLLMSIVNGKFYWASRGNRELRLEESGAFTYLYEGPGAYIKLTKVGNKIFYMEHAHLSVDFDLLGRNKDYYRPVNSGGGWQTT